MIFRNEEDLVTYLLTPLSPWTFRNIIVASFAALEDKIGLQGDNHLLSDWIASK